MIKKIVQIFNLYEEKIDFVNISDVTFSCWMDCKKVNVRNEREDQVLNFQNERARLIDA